MQITFNNTDLTIVEDSHHEFLVSNKDVALGYGVAIQSLSQAKKNNSSELIEGKHFIRLTTQTNGGKQNIIHWTKKGIVRLGFFIKSEKAKAFRDWAEDYITVPHAQTNPELEELKKTILAQNAIIAQGQQKQLPQKTDEKLQGENNRLRQTLINLHDGYHKILTSCSPVDMMKELQEMTSLFQCIGSGKPDGTNLNTQSIARHSYWK